MEIIKVFNNNVISALDDSGKEVVIMGRGLGFKASPGDLVEDNKIEKIFRMDSEKNLEKFEQLIENMPIQYLQVSNEIISYAKKELDVKLSPNVYLTLTDHISFSIERMQQGIHFENALKTELKMYYPTEYRIGLYALKMIDEKLGLTFPEDEAASIAMHLINAELNSQIKDVWGLTMFIQEVLDIIEAELEELTKTKYIQNEYLIAVIKYIGKRILIDQESMDMEEDELVDFVRVNYQREFHCAKSIAEYVENKYEKYIGLEEMAYLALDLKKLTSRYS